MRILPAFFILSFSFPARAQDPGSLHFLTESEIPSVCTAVSMTMLHDRQDMPFLYVANKEAGLKIYDITAPKVPQLRATVPTTKLDSLDVMSLSQQGNFLFLALGNHFNNKQHSGMAIVDVSDPEKPVLMSKWYLPGSHGGSGIIETEGNYAYLGAMGNGLVILDISDKKNVKMISRFMPDIKFPDCINDPSPKPQASKYNARSMAVKNDLVYLCFDAGGFRIINVKDKMHPRETGRFSNPSLSGRPRAYNNLVLDDSLVYVAVDYCGMEILNVSDTAHIKLRGWWNPCGCPNNNWFKSPVHANEIRFQKNCNRIFLSTGKSDMHVLDVSDHAHPNSIAVYGGENNKMGTWGIDVWKNRIFLSYVCAFIPYSSDWTGVKIITVEEKCE
ncbi:MAG TPA: hypothetical protein VI112_11415 [Bacteroidia bacterium]|jgi:hypothetical protein